MQMETRGEGVDFLGKLPYERGNRVVECKKMKDLERIGSKEEGSGLFFETWDCHQV